MTKLNKRQREFAIQYVKTGNATESAKSAGYKDKTAYSVGNRLLKNVEVKSYINSLQRDSFKRDIMTAEEALSTLSHIARGDVMTTQFVSGPLGTDEVQVPPTFAERNSALKEILKRIPYMTQEDKLKLLGMQQKQSEKDVDIAIKKRKLEILNGANDENIDQVSKLLDKVDEIYTNK
ncbi:terminase small subunit [Nicoliella lavandulae]|uniref:Terminase small subunit n=1 Tax=Nicoliella lavandulae TaxID=3082954 RepID=A0ABU8SP49_9LACO